MRRLRHGLKVQTCTFSVEILESLDRIYLAPRALCAADKLADMDANTLIDWMISNPSVIQRPVVVTDQGARIGRPPESVLEII